MTSKLTEVAAGETASGHAGIVPLGTEGGQHIRPARSRLPVGGQAQVPGAGACWKPALPAGARTRVRTRTHARTPTPARPTASPVPALPARTPAPTQCLDALVGLDAFVRARGHADRSGRRLSVRARPTARRRAPTSRWVRLAVDGGRQACSRLGVFDASMGCRRW